MDLKIQTDLSILPSVIEFNFEELKSEISERLEYYNNLVVTEDGVKNAKSDKANLNKLITAIEDKRKEIKKQCLEPYNDFENKCKALVSLVKAPINNIDTQIKEFEDIKKQEKYDDLKDCFDNYIGDMADIIEFDKILNPKWGNATAKIDTLKAEIEDNIDRIKKELETLNSEYADKSYKSAVISEYCREYNLGKALTYASQLKRDEERQRKILDVQDTASSSKITNTFEQSIIPGLENQITRDPLGTVSFKVTCSKSQLIMLRDYMKKISIKYKVLK